MDRLLIEERYTWPVRTVLLGGGGLRATSYQILLKLPEDLVEEIEAMGDYWERRLVTERILRKHYV